MKYLDSLHPIVLLLYFIAVVFITMFTLHPVVIGVSLLSAIVLLQRLIGFRELLHSLLYAVPVYLLIALSNPLFVHRGESILFFLNGNPITLEAVFYGLSCAGMIMAIFYWFRCYSILMCSDKFIYLFGRCIPKLALLLSMTLGLVPRLQRKYNEIDQAQRALGVYASAKFFGKIKFKIAVLSILITQALEQSIHTADSMSARGYGLKGRTSYGMYRILPRDIWIMIATVLLGGCVVTLVALHVLTQSYYPKFTAISLQEIAICGYICMAVLTMIPAIFETKERVQWQFYKRKI